MEDLQIEKEEVEEEREKRKWCVYMHVNKMNGKKYIGQTCQNPPKKRWANGLGYIESPKFWNAIQKYGWDGFEHIIIQDNLTLDEANSLEESLIKKYNTTSDEFGYNLQSGGENKLHSEETKKKIGEANKGRYVSSETREKISKANSGENSSWYGRKHTKEERDKISKGVSGEKNGMYGKIGSDNPWYGKHHSKETKKRWSKKVNQYDLNMNLIKTWDSIADAQNTLGISHISDCCKGKRKIAGNFLWRYKDEVDK